MEEPIRAFKNKLTRLATIEEIQKVLDFFVKEECDADEKADVLLDEYKYHKNRSSILYTEVQFDDDSFAKFFTVIHTGIVDPEIHTVEIERPILEMFYETFQLCENGDLIYEPDFAFMQPLNNKGEYRKLKEKILFQG